MIWHSLSLLWAVIIAGSQVISALRPLMPYTKRLKLLQDMHSEIVNLTLEVEDQWFGISKGDFTEREIHGKLSALKKKLEDISTRHLSSHVLPKKIQLVEKANVEVDQYLQKNYIGE